MKRFLFTLLLGLMLSAPGHAAVNINTATQAELETLDNIGPVKAQAIIDYRKKNGPFKSPSDLDKVDGIGAKTVENLRGSVTTSGTTTVVAPNNVKSDNAKAKAAKPKEVGNAKAAVAGKSAEVKSVKPTAPAPKAKPADKPVDKKN